MPKRFWGIFIAFTALLILSFIPDAQISAAPAVQPLNQSASEVIAGVNSLRSAHGLSPYGVNSILMGTAQGQADYMASIGTWTHTGPGGISVTQRLLKAGYPLAGDLSLGGFRSENVVMGTGMTPSEAVSAWTSDSIHLHTMLSTDLQEIGAGVAESGGMVYYVIDCARPTSSGVPQNAAPGAEAAYSAGLDQIIIPVTMSTADANGQIIHQVQAGQSLWQIAIAYGVKIDEIRKLNQLPAAYLINPGDKLLIKQVGTATAAPTSTDTPEAATPTELQTIVFATGTATETATPAARSPVAASPEAQGAVGAIVVVALVFAGVIAWMARSRPI